jgi:hypothetical protein
MKLYDVEASAQEGLSDAGHTPKHQFVTKPDFGSDQKKFDGFKF